MDKTLVILAAGMGSRYGGMKQIDPVGPDNSIIIEYSIYDAVVKAGFNKVVFIIKEENLEIFKEVVGDKISKFVKVEYVFQSLDNIPEGFTVPEGRIKPWGTAHAILCCKGTVKEPFIVINADDFYGRSAFTSVSEWIETKDFSERPYSCCMAGYYLKNTLTENGSVSRGICEIVDGKLVDIIERTDIKRIDGDMCYGDGDNNWVKVGEDTVCSMNCWCFPAEFIDELYDFFVEFLKNEVPLNPLKSECYLPFAVRKMLETKKCTVDVLKTTDKWVGVTYAEDKPGVVKAIAELVNNGIYPENLWK